MKFSLCILSLCLPLSVIAQDAMVSSLASMAKQNQHTYTGVTLAVDSALDLNLLETILLEVSRPGLEKRPGQTVTARAYRQGDQSLLLEIEVALEDEQAVAKIWRWGAQSIDERLFLFTKKKDYLHVLLDVFPIKDRLAAVLADTDQLKKVIEELLETVVKLRYPDETVFKVQVVEFPGRDEYEAPVWSSVKKIKHYKLKRLDQTWETWDAR